MRQALQEGSTRHKRTNSKLTTADQERSQLFVLLLESNDEQLRKVEINGIDLNFFEEVEELAFLDECVTPLIYCASLGRSYYNAGKTESAKLLVKNSRIDVDLQTPNNGQTPMIAACGGCNYQMVKLLLDSNAQPNKPNHFNQTPLVITVFRLLEEYQSFEVKRICLRILELLVQRGSDVNWVIDKQQGYTLLHSLCACSIRMSKAERQVNYEIIKFLLDSGADINMRGFDGKRPEDLVTGHCGMTAILDLIIKRKQLLVASPRGKQNSRFLPKKRVEKHLREMFEDLTQQPNHESVQLELRRNSQRRRIDEQRLLGPTFLSISKLKKK